jgi:hypothetical protein
MKRGCSTKEKPGLAIKADPGVAVHGFISTGGRCGSIALSVETLGFHSSDSQPKRVL